MCQTLCRIGVINKTESVVALLKIYYLCNGGNPEVTAMNISSILKRYDDVMGRTL